MKPGFSKQISAFFLLAITTILLNGCVSTSQMAFEDGSGSELQSEKPIYIMSVDLKNQYKTGHQPNLSSLHVEPAKSEGNTKPIRFVVSNKGSRITNNPHAGNHYLLRFQLDQGDYVIRGLTSTSRGFLIYGSFFTPIHEQLTTNGPGVYYLGNVDATVRERDSDANEFKAGSSIPLIDQAVVGASGGTFDVTISDKWDKDQKDFLRDFPMLKGVQITKAILPEFDRQRAQIWWDEH